jgi:transcriptional regulator with XRE-family HTH domain
LDIQGQFRLAVALENQPGDRKVVLVISRQIKAARALAGWEQQQLATLAGVAISTVRRLEGLNGPISAQFETVEKIRVAFEKAGVEFLGYPNPGVFARALADNGEEQE